ncbi:MAG: hypothetical protein Dasosvirus2_28 [Dasosvirus sp.]|uniref:Uncharacterized protein n=1 Tax=Dasosvirus sp. TaxID=2487764 RepID=A0A3G4ZR92_9VIRU|nr:MAG: hypothetical protein Dasosvirus2_28 [Dasosvirus sp.]
MYANVLILIIFIGIIFITINLVRTDQTCPPNKIIYRYIPRTLDEETQSPAYASDIFKSMFMEPSPWINSVDSMILRKREDINEFFISQI